MTEAVSSNLRVGQVLIDESAEKLFEPPVRCCAEVIDAKRLAAEHRSPALGADAAYLLESL